MYDHALAFLQAAIRVRLNTQVERATEATLDGGVGFELLLVETRAAGDGVQRDTVRCKKLVVATQPTESLVDSLRYVLPEEQVAVLRDLRWTSYYTGVFNITLLPTFMPSALVLITGGNNKHYQPHHTSRVEPSRIHVLNRWWASRPNLYLFGAPTAEHDRLTDDELAEQFRQAITALGGRFDNMLITEEHLPFNVVPSNENASQFYRAMAATQGRSRGGAPLFWLGATFSSHDTSGAYAQAQKWLPRIIA